MRDAYEGQAALSALQRQLLFEVHGLFMSSCAESARHPAGSPTRDAHLLKASQQYRACILSTTRVADRTGGDGSDVSEELKVAHAVWQACEVAFLRDDATATQGFLEWLRDNFIDPVDDSTVARVLDCLRSPSAAVDAGVAADVWDIAAKLTVEGQPRDAGKLLQLLAVLRREPELSTFATLLLSFPLLDASAAGDGAAQYAAAWASWKQALAAAQASGVGVGYNSTAAALMQVLAGEALVGLQGLSVSGDILASLLGASTAVELDPALATPFAHWYHVVLTTVLYAQPASLFKRPAMGGLVLAAMQECGAPLVDPAALPAQQKQLLAELPADDQRVAQLHAGLVAVLQGDAAAAVRALHESALQPWAAVHVADLLWRAGYLRHAIVWPGGWDAPIRAHLLLEHAEFMSRCAAGDLHAWAAAVDYASAAMPEVAAAVGAGLSGLSVGSTYTSPTHQLAALSGGAASAEALAIELLLRRPCAAERDALAAVSQAQRLGFHSAASMLRVTWGMRLLALGCAAGASRWLLQSDSVSGLQALAGALFNVQLQAITTSLSAWRSAGRPIVACYPGTLARPALTAPAWLEQLVAGQSSIAGVCDSWALGTPPSTCGTTATSPAVCSDATVGAATSALEWIIARAEVPHGDGNGTPTSSAVARVPLLVFVLRTWRFCAGLLHVHRQQLQQARARAAVAGRERGADGCPELEAALPAEDWAELLAALLPRSTGAVAGMPPPPVSTDGLPFPLLGALLLLGHAGGLMATEAFQGGGSGAATLGQTGGPSAPPPALTASQARVALRALQHLLGSLRATTATAADAAPAVPGDADASSEPITGSNYAQPTPEEIKAAHSAATRCAAVALVAARVF